MRALGFVPEGAAPVGGLAASAVDAGQAWAVAALAPDATKGAVAGFRWDPPRQGLPYLEIAPLGLADADEAHITVWILDGGPGAEVARLRTAVVGLPLRGTWFGGQASAIPADHACKNDDRPFLVPLSADAGLGVILAARGPAPAFGVALRWVAGPGDLSATSDALLANASSGGAALALPAAGAGQGMAAAYYETHHAGATAVELVAGRVELADVADPAPFAPPVRDVAASFDAGLESGWGWGLAGAVGSGAVRVDARMFGSHQAGDEVLVSDSLARAAFGSGAGGGSLRLEGALAESWDFGLAAVAMGAPAEALLGAQLVQVEDMRARVLMDDEAARIVFGAYGEFAAHPFSNIAACGA